MNECKIKFQSTFTNRITSFSFCIVLKSSVSSSIRKRAHTVRKSRNMNRAKQVSNFLICGAKHAVEHYGKRIKIVYRCPFEGARPSKPICQKGWDGRDLPFKRTPVQDFNFFSIMFYYIISTTHIKKLETYFDLLYFWTFAQCDLANKLLNSTSERL